MGRCSPFLASGCLISYAHKVRTGVSSTAVDVTDEPYFHQVEQRGFAVLATSVCVDPDDLPRDVLLIENCRKDTAGSFRGEPHRGAG